MFDENGQLIYPTNHNMPSSSNQPRSLVAEVQMEIASTEWISQMEGSFFSTHTSPYPIYQDSIK
jgi:hypothetical protein